MSVMLRDGLDSLWHSIVKVSRTSQTNQRKLHEDSHAVCVRLIVELNDCDGDWSILNQSAFHD